LHVSEARIIRHCHGLDLIKVLDISRQNGKVVRRISLPKPTAFPGCMKNPSNVKEKFAAVTVLQDPEVSE